MFAAKPGFVSISGDLKEKYGYEKTVDAGTYET
jgi:hypothetical protein